ncbi:hypothetical protein JCM10212_003664 [Sporobolomyces blumeae]
MPSEPERKTVIYRTVRGVDIALDYILPPSSDERSQDGKDDKLPVVVWFHGGGLIQGSRKSLYPHLLNAAARHHVCFISADYRLAPQTRFPGILSDLTCLFSYLLSPAFAKATDDRLDLSRIVTIGNSAGGYLSLIAGLGVAFDESGTKRETQLVGRIKGVVSIYGITSVTDSFWHEKQRPVSYADRVLTEDEMREHLDPEADEISCNDSNSDRNKMYTYMIQEAILQNLLLDGTDLDPELFTVARAVREERTVKPVPPVYLVHGTADDKVPHHQSVQVFEALRDKGHEVEYEEREGCDHSFDADEGEPMDKMWAWIVDKLKK